MTRVFTTEGPAYKQLLTGLLVLALIIFGWAIWLARALFSHGRARSPFWKKRSAKVNVNRRAV
jgi:hypothetical protein